MTLQQTFPEHQSELRTRYNLAHVSSATALQIALAELQGAKRSTTPPRPRTT